MEPVIAENINLNELHANTFLRALWAEFRINFKPTGWNYYGIKLKNTTRVIIGNLSLEKKFNLRVEFDYKKRKH